jgi:acetolactate synthase regulatory subunit
MGLISLSEVNGVPYIGTLDSELLEVVVKLRELGLNSERGFSVAQLKVYQEHMARLARMELTMALEGLVGRMPVEEVRDVASKMTALATDLVAIMHQKEVRRILGEQSGRMDERDK